MRMRLKDPQPRHPAVQARLDAAPGPGGEAARWLAGVVRDTVKDAEEGIYHSMPTWAVPGGPHFAHVEAYARHANLGFPHGPSIQDPEGLLQGSGKAYRFVRLAGPAAVPKAKLARLLRQARRLAVAQRKEEMA